LDWHRLEQQKQEIAEGFSYLLCSGDVQILSLFVLGHSCCYCILMVQKRTSTDASVFFFGRPQMFFLIKLALDESIF
jgi:hypothetical protein